MIPTQSVVTSVTSADRAFVMVFDGDLLVYVAGFSSLADIRIEIALHYTNMKFDHDGQ